MEPEFPTLKIFSFALRVVVVMMVESSSKVPDGHHPRGTTLYEALRGDLPRGPLRGFCGALPGSTRVVTLCSCPCGPVGTAQFLSEKA